MRACVRVGVCARGCVRSRTCARERVCVSYFPADPAENRTIDGYSPVPVPPPLGPGHVDCRSRWGDATWREPARTSLAPVTDRGRDVVWGRDLGEELVLEAVLRHHEVDERALRLPQSECVCVCVCVCGSTRAPRVPRDAQRGEKASA